MSSRDIYRPSPEELAKRCAEVRAGWSAAVEQRRRAYTGCNQGWEVPWVESEVGKDIPRNDLEPEDEEWWSSRSE